MELPVVEDQSGYKRERYYIRDRYGEDVFRKVQTCHIAHVKDTLGLTGRVAANRIDADIRAKPCPPDLWPIVEDAVRHVHLEKLNG